MTARAALKEEEIQLNAPYNQKDTIAAESTPPGKGGISVIRISGEAGFQAAGKIFDRPLPDPGQFKFGTLIHDNRIIDQAVISCFKAPYSYTGQDVVEVSIHGSPVIVNQVLECLYRLNVRPAQPGEFTYRAYLNNRIDLTQAEAVSDIVSSRSKRAAEQALKQLSGELGERIKTIVDLIMRALITCELELDFVEEDIELMTKSEKLNLVNDAVRHVESLKRGYNNSRLLREGVKTAIIGPPNVGKSTLFNRLVGEERAIIHKEPGTTRDVLQASCIINGIEFTLYDTAGIHLSSQEVEDEGIRRAKKIAESADLLVEVYSVDNPSVGSVVEKLDVKSIKVMNKIDLDPSAKPEGFVHVSARDGINVDKLTHLLYESVIEDDHPNELTINRERHYRCVNEALDMLGRAVNNLEANKPAELVAEDLRSAIDSIDQITGGRHRENLLETIFNSFCVGK